MELWHTGNIGEVIKTATQKGWTRLAVTRDMSYARVLVRRGWPNAQIILTRNALTLDLLQQISELPGLEALELGWSGIDDQGVRAVAKSGPQLRYLGLESTRISDHAVRNLARHSCSIESLGLSSNTIGAAGISHLADLPRLKAVSLAGNQLIADAAKRLAALAGLVKLDLFDNRIGPEGIGHLASLAKLEWLDVSGNMVRDAGASALAALQCLKWLDLGGNGITPEGSGSLARLESLAELDMTGNHIGDVGVERLSSLVGLERLVVSRNDIENIPREVVRLKELRILGLERNSIRSLPEELAMLPKLRMLFLAGNDIDGLPREMMLSRGKERDRAPRAQQILDYYFRLREQEEEGRARPLNEAKILVVGQPEVGKTDLTHWLIHDQPHSDPKTTEGIQIECWTPEGDDGVKINVWDFGGQEIMRATHQFFLTERSLYLLVLDSRQSEEQSKVRSWLERIANFGKDAPVLVALNKADQWEPSFNRAQLRKDYPENLGKIAFFETACQDGRRVNKGSGIDALRTHILERVRELDGVRKPMPAEFHSAKAAIQAEARAKSKLTHERFDEICIEHGILDAGQRKLLLYWLKTLGALFHYHTHAGEGSKARTFVLDPQWLTAGVYAILTNPGLGEKDGVLDQRDLPAIFGDAAMTRDRTYTAEDRDFILDMMEGEPFELCFPLPDQPGKRWLVPQLLDTDTPDHGIERTAGIALRYEYRHLPTGLVPRFIVRTHTKLGEAKPWRDGAVLAIDGARVLVLGVPEKNYVDVIAEERTPAARRAVRFVRDQLEMIHEAMKLEGVEAWLTPPDDPNGRASLSKLYRWRAADGKGDTYEFEPEGAERDYTVGELLDHLEQGAAATSRPSEWLDKIIDIHRMTEDEQRASARRYRDLRSGQSEIKAQNDEILQQSRAHHEALVRLLLDEAKDGPRLFSFRALEPGFFNRPKWASTKFRITLWCEHAHVPLPAINGLKDTRGVYEIDVPREWLIKAAPTLKLLTATLGTLLPVGAAAAKLAIDETAYPQIGDQLKLGETTANALIKAGGKSVDALASESGAPTPAGGPGSIRANGPTLRQLQDWLKNEDASFGGLERVRDPGGGILWVHPRYKGEYTGSA